MLAIADPSKRRGRLSRKPSLVMCFMVAFSSATVKSACHAGGPAHAVASCLTLFETPVPCFSALCFGPCGGLLIAAGRSTPLPSGLAPLGLRIPGTCVAVPGASPQPVFPCGLKQPAAARGLRRAPFDEAGAGALVIQRAPARFYLSTCAAPGLFAFPLPPLPGAGFFCGDDWYIVD